MGRQRWVAALACAALALVGCSTSAEEDGAARRRSDASPAPTVTTLEPLPPPAGGPPAGRLVADLRQSSRDVAYGRFQVWIGNGLETDLRPRVITYLDPRVGAALRAGRLRRNPAGSERGYPLALPPRPDCAQQRGAGRVRVRAAGGRTRTLPVTDEAEVVARYVRSRCVELAVERVARLSFADRVPVDRSTDPPTATILLEVRPTGRRGTLRIAGVSGTPVLTSAAGADWRIDRRVSGAGDPVRIPLRTVPSRCDPHVFMEATGATTFRVRLTVGGLAGDVLLPMSPRGARAALTYATDTCGL